MKWVIRLEEIKKLILEDDEVDTYNDLQNKFDECVNDEVNRRISLNNSWKILLGLAIAWIGMMIVFAKYGILT